jgi:hypothetical protein
LTEYFTVVMYRVMFLISRCPGWHVADAFSAAAGISKTTAPIKKTQH